MRDEDGVNRGGDGVWKQGAQTRHEFHEFTRMGRKLLQEGNKENGEVGMLLISGRDANYEIESDQVSGSL